MIFDYISRKSVLPFEQQVAQNFTSELQWSPNFTLGFIINGEMKLHYEMHSRDFKEHDFLFFMPTQSFTVVSSTEDARILFLSIDNDFIEYLCPEFSSMKLTQSHIHSSFENPVYISLCEDLATIVFHNLKKDHNTKIVLLRAITHIIEKIVGNYCVTQPNPSISSSQDRKISILQYLDEHYADRVTVNDIADFLGLHPQYFSSYFKKNFSVNFWDYLNTYRINRSIYDLCYTNESVLNIALNHGFNSHKTYSTAFKKLYNCTPMEYRKSNIHSDGHGELSESVTPSPDEGSDGPFSFFRQFYFSDLEKSATSINSKPQKKQQTINFSLLSNPTEAKVLDNFKVISVGRAFLLLRSEMHTHLEQLVKDIDIQYIRIRDIFSDDMYVYYEDEHQKPVYNWSDLDSIFDYIRSLNLKPLVEIGYMPEALAYKRQYAGVVYSPNVSKPKSYEKWQNLVNAFLIHYIDRYGAKELEQWYFSFWTSPDLENKNSYWNDTQDEFFKFYEKTYYAFRNVPAKLKFGTANFSTISGYPWYESFFSFCYSHKLYPDFLDFHAYGIRLQDKSGLESYLGIKSENFSVNNPNSIHDELSTIETLMNRCGFRNLEIIVSDWNLSFLPKDLIRDTCYMGPYICHTLIHSFSKIKAMSLWSLSDIHDEAFPNNALFSGGPGIMDFHGIRKASYNALTLVSRLGNKIYKIGENYIISKNNNIYQILVYNLAEFDDMYSNIDPSAIDSEHRYQIYNEKNISLNIILQLPAGTYYIKRSEVNRNYGSAYDMWTEMGSPKYLHKELVDHLRYNSVPHSTYFMKEVDSTLLLEEELPSHGILLIEISTNDSVMKLR